MCSWHQRLTQSRGFSLIELIVVMAIISTLIIAATIGFHEWQVKYNVEAQVKTMLTDFSELRVRAMTTKQRHSITVNKQNYVFKSYSSDDELLDAGTVMPPATRTVNYSLKKNSTTFYTGQVFEIDHRGMLVATTGTIYLDSNSSATLDCLILHTVRTNPGKKSTSWSCDD